MKPASFDIGFPLERNRISLTHLPIHHLFKRREFVQVQRLAQACKSFAQVCRSVSKSCEFGFSIWSYKIIKTHNLFNKTRKLFHLVENGDMLLSFPSVPYPYTVLFGTGRPTTDDDGKRKNLFKINLEWASTSPDVKEFCDHHSRSKSTVEPQQIFSWSHLEMPSMFPHLFQEPLDEAQIEIYKEFMYTENNPKKRGDLPMDICSGLPMNICSSFSNYKYCAYYMALGTIKDMYQCGLLK